MIGAELRQGPGRALQRPQQLREVPAVSPSDWPRATERRDLGQPVRQPRQPARRISRPPARRSGTRPAARSTPSSAPAAPAARWPASRMALKAAQPDGQDRPRRSRGRGALWLVHDGELKIGRHLDHRGHRPGPRDRQSRGRADRRRLSASPTRRRSPVVFDLAERRGAARSAAPPAINVAGAIRVAREHGAGPHDRHGALRRRRRYAVQAVQSGVPARQRTCRRRPGWQARRRSIRGLCKAHPCPADALDVRAAAGQLFLQPLEAAVEVIDAVDHGLALGRERRRSPARPRRADRSPSPARPRSCSTPSTMAVSPSSWMSRAEPRQLLHMHEAVLEDRLGDARGALGARPSAP